MKTILVSAAALAAAMLPTAAQAQAVPPAIIAVVDLEKVTGTCNACVTAKAALQSQVNALQARERALSAPIETEGKAIQGREEMKMDGSDFGKTFGINRGDLAVCRAFRITKRGFNLLGYLRGKGRHL